jgi:DNA-binding NarL/FixJ family response regulator
MVQEAGRGAQGAGGAVVADGDPLARRTIRAALERAGLDPVEEAAGTDEALALVRRRRPALLVTEAALELVARVAAEAPEVRIACLTAVQDDELALRALRLGATSWIPKALDPAELPAALRAAAAGEPVIPGRLTALLVERWRRAAAGGMGLRPVRSPLTPREWEVLDLLSRGAGTREVAGALGLTVDTVRSHVKHVLRKLGVSSRAQAVEAARRLRAEPEIAVRRLGGPRGSRPAGAAGAPTRAGDPRPATAGRRPSAATPR